VDPCVLPLGADCSVQEEECVDRVRAVITCMRDAEHPAPKIVRMTPDEYIDQLEEPEPATEEEARRSLQTVRAFTLLRLLPADPPQGSGEVYLPSPYISYDWEKGELLIVADGADPEAELAALLYTLVLADRDAEVGIAGLLSESGTVDGDRAIVALLAGEATFYSDLAGFRDADYGALAEVVAWDEALAYVRDKLADPDEPWYGALGAFQYYYGAAATLRRYVDGGPAAVSDGYKDAATSTAFALAQSDEIAAMFSGVDTQLPAPPEGFEYLFQDSYGPVVWYMSDIRVNEQPASQPDAEALARAWIGDRMVVAAEIDGDRVAVVWQLASPDGMVAETKIVGSDDEVRSLFGAAFE
jgi:hypothetical protein